MEDIIKGFTLLFEFQNIALIFGGVLVGVLVGALPGLSSPMAIALLMPFTISLDPVASISMMAALYCAGTFGGSITAILINAPGAPPAVATALDGYQMAKKWRTWKSFRFSCNGECYWWNLCNYNISICYTFACRNRFKVWAS